MQFGEGETFLHVETTTSIKIFNLTCIFLLAAASTKFGSIPASIHIRYRHFLQQVLVYNSENHIKNHCNPN